MAQFDATFKDMCEAKPADWLKMASLPIGGPIEIVDADVSAISAASDKVIRVGGAERLKAELPPEESLKAATAMFIVGTLRHDEALMEQLIERAFHMEESAGYQLILGRGVEKGRLEEARRMLLRVGGQRFGDPDASATATLNALSKPEEIEFLADGVLIASSWQELLERLVTPQ